MNLIKYQTLALRTAVLFDDPIDNLVHAALGLTGEAGEICELTYQPRNFQNVSEEMGDMMWYVALGAEALAVELFSLPVQHTILSGMIAHENSDGTLDRAAVLLSQYSGEFADIVKKMKIYSQPLNEEKRNKLIYSMGCVVGVIDAFCRRWQHSIEGMHFSEILQANIDKLSIRYPEKFTPELAALRLDKKGA